LNLNKKHRKQEAMLKFDVSWRYDSQGKIQDGVLNDFLDVIRKIARGEQKILEHYKQYFASASGNTSSWSSSASWADSDLLNYMGQATDNAPMFIEAFYDACESLKAEHDYPAPDVQFINKVLAKHSAAYRIELPNLVLQGSHVTAPPPDIPASLDENARELIQTSISEGQKFMSEGRYRQAVQEVLWLLETVTTAFQGLSDGETSIEGKYFNKIIEELRRNKQGSALEQIIGWITRLHGYLSAPAGGGIRHGMHLKEGVATSQSEARLYYNLIVSYISYLLSEYDRIQAAT
jgi:hypothetical protein